MQTLNLNILHDELAGGLCANGDNRQNQRKNQAAIEFHKYTITLSKVDRFYYSSRLKSLNRASPINSSKTAIPTRCPRFCTVSDRGLPLIHSMR